MPRRVLPRTPEEYFHQKLRGLPAGARLVVALDPEEYLVLKDELTDPTGLTWRVYPYQRNDLAFRSVYPLRPGEREFPHIVWVTRDPESSDDKIDLNYIPDILGRAEDIVDLSLAGILKHLIPQETWRRDTLASFSSIIAADLSRFVAAYRELRYHIGRDLPLNVQHLRALALVCSEPQADLRELLFEETGPGELLKHYLRLIWSHSWTEHTEPLVKELVRGARADAKPAEPWLTPAAAELALYAYLRQLLHRYQVHNPVNQLRGLQLLSFDPDALEPQARILFALLEENDALAQAVTRQAEERLTAGDMGRVLKVIIPGTLADVRRALLKESSPALVYGMVTQFLRLSLSSQTLSQELRTWQPGRIALSTTDPTATFADAASHAVQLLDHLASIEQTLARPPQVQQDLVALAEEYTEKTQAYRLELTLAQARHSLKGLQDTDLVQRLTAYLDNLHGRIRQYLKTIDLALADIITRHWPDFEKHPRLAINLLRDTILKPKAHPPYKPRVWVLIFDGMRWDTWQEIVRPLLTKEFEVTSEKAYFSVLPSFTDVARVSLLAGNLPAYWKDYRGQPTMNHYILSARLLNLADTDREAKLRVITSCETDTGQRQLDERPKIYNVLIYNLSDNWIHSFRDDVRELNQVIAQKVETGILPDLRKRIAEGDMVVVTSDHGFIELDPRDEIKVKPQRDWSNLADDDPKNPVVYRYLRDLEHPDGFKVQSTRDRFYTVAKGHSWFGREQGHFSRYTHGGISMAEMLIPGAVLKRSVTPFVRFELDLPSILKVQEREEALVKAIVRNIGNREGKYTCVVTTNTGGMQEYQGKLGPNVERSIEFPFVPTAQTKVVTYRLTFRDMSGREQSIPQKSVAVEVALRTDIVEIGGLEALDGLVEE